MINCKTCGNQLIDTAKFCSNCGENLILETTDYSNETIERINSLDIVIQEFDNLLSSVDFEKYQNLEEKFQDNWNLLKFSYEEINNNLSRVSNLIIDKNLIYIGEIEDGKRHGKGTLFEKSDYDNEIEILYHGNWIDDQKNGNGTSFTISLIEYIGEWENDVYCGNGKLYLDINSELKIYERSYIKGDFIETPNFNYSGIPSSIIIENGKKYNQKGILNFEGSFELERKVDSYSYEYYNFWKINGLGKEYYTTTNQIKYEGEYKFGIRQGQGKEYFENGYVSYDGEWKENDRNGNGTQYFENGSIKQEGVFQNDVPFGRIKIYWESGKLNFDGIIFMDQDGNTLATGTIVYNENGELVNVKGHNINGRFIPDQENQSDINSPIKPKDGAGLR